MREFSSVRVGAVVLVGILLFVVALLMPSSWLARSNVALVGSPLPGSAGVLFFRAALILNGLLLLLLWWSLRRSEQAVDTPPIIPLSSEAVEEIPGRVYVCLGLVLVLAAVLRFWKLGGDLWFDEVIDLVYYVRGSALDIFIRFPGFFPQVVSALSSKLSASFLGESAWALRLPEAVFGILAVWGIFLLTRLINGVSEALLAALLLATSYHHVFFSQTSRGYSAQILFTILATTALLRASATNHPSAWLAYALFSILNLYTHIFAVFVWVGLLICYFIRWLQQRFELGRPPMSLRRFLWSNAFIASVTFLLYSPMTPGLLVQAGITMPSPGTGPTVSGGFVQELLHGLQSGYGSVAILVLISVFLIGLGTLAKDNWYAAAVLMMPIVLGLGAVVILHMGSHPRYFIYALPAGIIVVSRGIVALTEAGVSVLKLQQPGRVVQWISAALIGAVALISVHQLIPYYRVPKQDFSGALEFAEQMKKPDDVVVAVGLAAHAYSVYYAPSIQVVRSVDDARSLQQRGHRVWLLYTLPFELQDRNPELWNYIQDHFQRVRLFPGTIGDGALVVCEAEPL